MLRTERWPVDPNAPARPRAQTIVQLESPREASLRTAVEIQANTARMWEQIAHAAHHTIGVLRHMRRREMSRSDN